MIFKATLSNKAHPEYGQATIPFPIPGNEYDHTIELLETMDLGDTLAQDCRVDEISSNYPILNRLVVQSVNVDELDYLAKRLESFCVGENHQFQAMACKLGLADIKDLINLTFCCQQATVITDFSNLEKVGKDHRMNLNGGTMPTEEYDRLDGTAIAIDLINSRAGTITPYGVVYSNDMKLEPLYDGRHFPAYLYEPPQMVIEVNSGQDGSPTGYLCLPAPDQQIQRTLQRAGAGKEGFRMTITMDDLPTQVSAVISPDRDSCDDLNQLCRAVEPLSTAERKKLEAVVLMAQPTYASEIHRLVENLEQFDFVPSVESPEQNSQINELGYVAYHGSSSLQELMSDAPGPQMGGLS